MRYKCGCDNEIHHPSGVLRSVVKCAKHRARQRDPATLDQRYYEELGMLKGGELQTTNHVAELAEALGPFPGPVAGGDALEIGCGVSPYAGAMQDAGWRYLGLDLSPWASGRTREVWNVGAICGDWESWCPIGKFGLILAAHSIEHMRDAPAAIRKMAEFLELAGELWIIVPDDSDPVNPDHLFFFTPETLRSTIEAAGLEVVTMAVRKHVPHERFIYARARKPA